MRRLLVWLVKKVRSPKGLLAIAFLALALSLIKDLSEKDAAALTTVGILGLAASFGKTLKDAGILQRVWDRLSAPVYPEVQTYLSRIGGQDWGKFSVRRDDGSIQVDSLKLAKSYDHLVRRIQLCGRDVERLTVASRINAKAFSGSKYQASFDDKLDRNSKICNKSHEAIAIVRSADSDDITTGMSGVFPLAEFYYTPYIMGNISDNEISHSHVAEKVNERTAVLFFMIAHCPYRNGKFLPKQAGVETVSDLIGCSLIQAFLISAKTGASAPLECLVANSSPNMQVLFTNLGFVERVNMNTKDNERLYSVHIQFLNAKRALSHLKKVNPSLLQQT